MNRLISLSLLLAACGAATQTNTVTEPVAPSLEQAAAEDATVAPEAAVEKPDASRLEVVGAIGATESTISIGFLESSDSVSVEFWGATGLKLASAPAWTGAVEAGATKVYTIQHTGSGDLALRIEGTVGGSAVHHVESFTVGERHVTPVPVTEVDGTPVRGWEGTRRD